MLVFCRFPLRLIGSSIAITCRSGLFTKTGTVLRCRYDQFQFSL